MKSRRCKKLWTCRKTARDEWDCTSRCNGDDRETPTSSLPCKTVVAGSIRRTVRQNHSAGSVGGPNRPAGSCLHYSAYHSLCFSCGARGRSVGRWRAAWRREQVGIETDASLFSDDVGSVDTNVSRNDCVGLCFVWLRVIYMIAPLRTVLILSNEKLFPECGCDLSSHVVIRSDIWTVINYRAGHFLHCNK